MSLPLSSYERFTRHLEDREFFGQKLGLERICALLDRMGNPEKRFPSIHIAGTNGKGSTAAMIASILREAGYRVGLFTSPHLQDFCERIRVESGLITPNQVLHYARLIKEVEEEPLTFFELATAIAFLHFSEEKVDLAVVETGLGGRLDATNVITPLVSVITTIGLDHTIQLGSTLEEIAYEKAGIIKPGVPVVTGLLEPAAMEVIREVASARKTRCFPRSRELHPMTPIGLAGRHQRRNAILAVAASVCLEEFGSFAVSEEAILKGLENVVWPGRLETVQEAPWVLLDGAHNPQAMTEVRAYLEERLNGRRLRVLFGAMADKDIKGVLAEIAPVADEFVFTAPPLKRAADPYRILEIASIFGKPASVIPEVGPAVESVLKRLHKDEILLVTGSLFVVGEARKEFR